MKTTKLFLLNLLMTWAGFAFGQDALNMADKFKVYFMKR
jgi:hypothetical protein